MAPPGGGSSNIFGTDPEPARQVKNYQRSQIFGGGDDAQEQVKTGKKHGAHPADSNIFGNSDENKPATARGKRKGDVGYGVDVPQEQGNVNPYLPPPQNAPVTRPVRGKGHAPSHNIITGEAYAGHEGEASPLRTGRKRGSQRAPEGGAFNPITGEKYDTQNGEDEEEEKVKPSVKLYHPSGGASSGIFG